MPLKQKYNLWLPCRSVVIASSYLRIENFLLFREPQEILRNPEISWVFIYRPALV